MSFLDPVPDSQPVRQVADTFQGLHQQHVDLLERIQRAHEATQRSWAGPASEAHTASTETTQEVAEQQAEWLVLLADGFGLLANTLDIISWLIKAYWVLQGAAVAWAVVGSLTAGAGLAIAGDTEAASAEVEADIQATRMAIQVLLRTLAAKLDNERVLASTVIGTMIGLGVGVMTAEARHESGWRMAGTIAGDTFAGGAAGFEVGEHPLALGGAAVGVGDVATHDATSGRPFEAEKAFRQGADDTGTVGTLTGAIVDAPSNQPWNGQFTTLQQRTTGIESLLKAPSHLLITPDNVQHVVAHVWRFAEPGQGLDSSAHTMVDRLRKIADGQLQPTQHDTSFYAQQLNELGQYQAMGWPAGQPSDPGEAYALWKSAHTAALNQCQLPECILNPAGQREWQSFDPTLWSQLGR